MQTRQTTVAKAPALAPAISISTYQSVPIVGLGTYVPPSFSQSNLLAELGLIGDSFAESIAANAGIDSRNFTLSFAQMKERATSDFLAQYHREQAPRMAAEALRAAAGDTIDLASIDAVITATSTGYMLPGIGEVLCESYGIGRRSGHRYNLVGQGCVAAIPAMQIARGLITSRQAKRVAVVCTEPQSALFNPQAEGKTAIIQQLIFGEGAGCLILDADAQGSGALPSIIDSEQELAPGSLEAVCVRHGSVWDSLLDRRVPDIAGAALPGVVSRLLARHGLKREQVKHWAFHPGGRRVLEVCQEGMGLADTQMAPSYEVLRHHGNMSSGSVFFSLDRLIAGHSPRPGDVGLMVAFGPGMVVGAFLIRWES